MTSVLSLAIGVLPVLVFLLALIALDSYKLLELRSVLLMLLGGAVVAQISLVVHSGLLAATALETTALARYVAPLVEEGLKGAIIVVLLARHRIGFLVDAAIRGFAIGAGFAAVENVYYFLELDDARPVLWVVRGFGTAIMHGGVTALMAVIAKHYTDIKGHTGVREWLPAIAAAVILHSFFNHFILPPLQSVALLAVVLPLVFAVVFRASEKSTRTWLGVGFDTDSELLEAINSGQVSTTRVGEYLSTLRQRFDPVVLVDMLCLIRLHLELSVKAKGILLAREAGFDLQPDRTVDDQFRELRHLEHTIGATGNLALKPIFNMSSRDLWQFYLLGGKKVGAGPKLRGS